MECNHQWVPVFRSRKESWGGAGNRTRWFYWGPNSPQSEVAFGCTICWTIWHHPPEELMIAAKAKIILEG